MLVESEYEFDYNTKFISESDFKWIWIGLPESVYTPTPQDWLVISYLLQWSISHSLIFYQTFFLGGFKFETPSTPQLHFIDWIKSYNQGPRPPSTISSYPENTTMVPWTKWSTNISKMLNLLWILFSRLTISLLPYPQATCHPHTHIHKHTNAPFDLVSFLLGIRTCCNLVITLCHWFS